MQIQNISNNNSFKALYIDKNVDLDHKQQLFKQEHKLNRIANKCDLYISKETIPIKRGSDYIIGENFLRWEIAPLGSKEKSKKSFLSIFKKEKTPKVFIGYSELYNQNDIKRMVRKANRNALNIDYVMEHGQQIS